MEDMKTEDEISSFKNESLGMAVLHMSHQALQTGSTLQEVAKKHRYFILKDWILHWQERKEKKRKSSLKLYLE